MNKAEYSGEDLSAVASIVRDRETKAASFQSGLSADWSLYGGRSVGEIDLRTPLLTGSGGGTFPLEVPDSVRSYFQLVTDHGKAILAERRLPMAGGYNFRDMGGIRTADGHFVKWGQVLRSDELSSLTDSDLAYLNSIPVTTVVDFRSPEETAAQPDRLPASVRERRELPMMPGNLANAVTAGDLSSLRADSLMREMYRLLVSDSSCLKQYRTFFALLQDEAALPLLFHCSAGKDRTGVGAALYLYALGVDPEAVMQDYLTSDGYAREKYAAYIQQAPDFAPLFGVQADFLQAALDQITSDYGTVERFLTEALEVDLGQMRRLHLY